MKSILLAVLISVALAQDPIWSIVGGEVGIGSCYDIVTEAITFPAYKFTFDQNNTIDIRGATYLLPDSAFGYSSPDFDKDYRLMIMDSFESYYHEYISTWGVSAGISYDGFDLKFAFSHTKGQINALTNNSINSFAENTMTWSEFEVMLWPGLQTLHPMFVMEVNKLPQQYDQDAYLAFVKTFGTHVITKTAYGANINFTAVFKSSLVDKETMTWVKNQISISIGYMANNVGINWNNFSNTSRINDTFLLNSNNVTTVSGGQPDLLTSSGFAAWYQSVTQDYATVIPKVTIQPLSSIIPDKVIAANLAKAIIYYGNQPPAPGRLNHEGGIRGGRPKFNFNN